MDSVLSIAIFCSVFFVLYNGLFERTATIAAGAGIMLLVGTVFDFYSLQMAWSSVYFETLILIFGMSMISTVLFKAGVFHQVAHWILNNAEDDSWHAVILLLLITYSFSLVTNNLAAMVVLIPLTLIICMRMGLNPIPVLIAEIVASNLGGASTMIGDFPNMLIAGITKLRFIDFLGNMMPPCLILLAILMLWLNQRKSSFSVSDQIIKNEPIKDSIPDQPFDAYLFRLSSITLVAVLFGFILADSIGIRPAYFALIGGTLMMIFGRLEVSDLYAASGSKDILFFGCLFVLVGGLKAAGVLTAFGDIINFVGSENHLIQLLLLMWLSAGVTIFLNAGPATAFFIPVAMSLEASQVDITVWWALSLGVLAGSSASLTGATAGSLASNQLEKFILEHPEIKKLMPENETLDFKTYLHWGLPIMVMFLVVSSIYISLIVD